MVSVRWALTFLLLAMPSLTQGENLIEQLGDEKSGDLSKTQSKQVFVAGFKKGIKAGIEQAKNKESQADKTAAAAATAQNEISVKKGIKAGIEQAKNEEFQAGYQAAAQAQAKADAAAPKLTCGECFSGCARKLPKPPGSTPDANAQVHSDEKCDACLEDCKDQLPKPPSGAGSDQSHQQGVKRDGECAKDKDCCSSADLCTKPRGGSYKRCIGPSDKPGLLQSDGNCKAAKQAESQRVAAAVATKKAEEEAAAAEAKAKAHANPTPALCTKFLTSCQQFLPRPPGFKAQQIVEKVTPEQCKEMLKKCAQFLPLEGKHAAKNKGAA